ncbi:MAG: cell wall hydrolase [Alphaproteobacteria bacterium]|jgi:spore germination cell wall hydrolase CwlJ-like protein|nr:cell wall hydrolase [Alphaproteobacteria bacterium]MBU1560121.1 cell wall hydrolase [Alphaproteobacteria bacterium]MBU2302595.1 cell wall hydrolase [Alphaproteobacteria bacterium]MBU2367583.1 cell wall hydrolase [Alphaproteobacteria bacterium]
MAPISRTILHALTLAVSASVLGGCSFLGLNFGMAQLSEKECLMRAMYFESNRSSSEGMLAVGTVVMNRQADPRYPKTVCGVVGQKNQFAQGVLTRKMTDSGAVLASQMADQVLRGARHPGVQNAQHFHTAGLRFPYNNMYYVLEAGGNEFYEKRSPVR